MTDQVYAVRTSEDFATQAEAAFDWLEQKLISIRRKTGGLD